MRRKILRARFAEEKPNIMKFTPEVWGPRVLITKDLAVIAHRIGYHYVVSIMKTPTDLASLSFLLCIHSNEFFKWLQTIITQDVRERHHAQRRNKKDSR